LTTSLQPIPGLRTIALELHLASSYIEAGDQLLVRAGGGVSEDRFVKLRFDRMEIDVLYKQHRTLPDRRHGLMGRIRLIDTKPHFAWIGY
jgi:hypothetical protein